VRLRTIPLAPPRGVEAGGSYLDSKFPLGKVSLPLLCLIQLLPALVLGQTSSNGAGLLRSEVERKVRLALVKEAELRSLVGVDDCEDSGD
jgi:hypothetical protein